MMFFSYYMSNKTYSYSITMSAEPQPDPLLPIYSPSSWDIPQLSAEERAVLDANYIKFPVAQNAPIFFTNDVFAPTVATTNNSGLVATTQFVNNFFAYVRTQIWTWSGLQIFSSGITTNSITPFGSTLQIGDAGSTITIGSVSSTININAPLTPLYSYPTALTKNGNIQTFTVASLAIVAGNTDIPQNLTQLTLDPGVYILVGSATIPASNNGLKLVFCSSTSLFFSTGRSFTNQQQESTAGVGSNTTTIIISINTTQTWVLGGQTLTTGNWTNITLSATRVA
jgi:hypothetical protein